MQEDNQEFYFNMHSNGVSTSRTLENGECWADVLNEFVLFLRGCGYIIGDGSIKIPERFYTNEYLSAIAPDEGN